MNYRNYAFRTYTHLATMKKELKGEKNLPKTWSQFFQFFIDNIFRFDEANEFEAIILSEEYQALKSLPEFLFIDSQSTCEIIKKGKFSADQLSLEQGVKFISFPKESRINNLPVLGCMITYSDYVGREKWHNEFFTQYGSRPPRYVSDADGYISVTYLDPINHQLHCRFNVEIEKLPAVLAAENTDELMAAIDFETIGDALTDDEKEYQLPIIQLAIKSLVYAQAMPEKCIEGAPPNKATPKNVKAKATYLKPPYEASEFAANPTVVGYHWRQLRHEKYYKGEHRDKPIGSRWSFIPPYEKNLKATTITNEA